MVKPRVIVCLGATAAQALLGRGFRVTQRRGEIFEEDGHTYMATVHPSSILRAPDDDTRHRELARLVVELQQLRRWLQGKPSTSR